MERGMQDNCPCDASNKREGSELWLRAMKMKRAREENREAEGVRLI